MKEYKLNKPSFKDIVYFSKNILAKVDYKVFLPKLQDKINQLNYLQRQEFVYVEELKEGLDPTQEQQEEQDERVDTITRLSQELLFDIVGFILDNIEKVEIPVYTFFGKISNMTADEFSELSFDEVTDIIKQFFKNEGFDSFFKSVSI